MVYYGRGIIDPDTTKKGLQVEFTVQDRAFSRHHGQDV
jgi:hypothetical protein